MTMKRSALILICCFSLNLMAAVEDLPVNARLAGVGGAGSAIYGSTGNLFYNPGALVFDERWNVDFHSCHLYGIKDLGLHAATGAFNFNNLTVAAGGYVFGNSAYQEYVYALGAAIPITSQFHLGAALRYAGIDIAHYGNSGSVLVDLGGCAEVLPMCKWGWAVRNVNAACIGKSGEKLPQIYITGIAINPVSHISVVFDVYKDNRFKTDYRTGIEWAILPIVTLRAGCGSFPQRMTGGISLQLGCIEARYAFQSHQYLNGTHLFTLSLFKIRL